MAVEQPRATLQARLLVRRGEIEQAVLSRVTAIADPSEVADPTYVESLRSAVSAALDYGLTAVERGEERASPPPAVLLAQARIAARSGVGLDTVLRRYFAGYALLSDFLIEEAEQGSLLGSLELKRLLGAQAAIFDRLLAAVSEEYGRETEKRFPTVEQRRAERVERLLAGELIDTTELAYRFDSFHLGLVATGVDVQDAIRSVARSFDCLLLLVRRAEGSVWAWLGSQSRLESSELKQFLSSTRQVRAFYALGESAEGLAGWRLTHRQAKTALPVALRSSQGFVRYADVALLASIQGDDLLASSFRQLFLAPLEQERDAGMVAKGTLRAYFAADRNVTSAAAALGVSRRTVTNRLRAVEENLGFPLGLAAIELEVALRLDQLEDIPRSVTARTGNLAGS